MRKLAMTLVIVLCCTTGAAYAQGAETGESDFAAGFRLGKFYVSANMLATELEIMQSLGDAFQPAMITDENYDAGLITDDDITGAQMFLGYALWRVQFLILPVCQAGLDEESFVEESLTPFKDDTQAVLNDLLADVNTFLDGSDFVALAAFVDNTKEADYANRLYDLADSAQAAAGVEDDMVDTELEAPAAEPAE